MKNYVITIARGYGSGGKTLGKMLAEELGIHYYDRELMRLASDRSGINEEIFVEADENLGPNPLTKLTRKLFRKGWDTEKDDDDYLSHENLFQHQAEVIRELAAEESCVIVGRCADYILRDCDNVIKIYVHASKKDCLERLKGLMSGSERELERMIQTRDKYRAEYYKYYTGREWTDAGNYDLCLNSGNLDFDTCVNIIKEFLRIRLGEEIFQKK